MLAAKNLQKRIISKGAPEPCQAHEAGGRHHLRPQRAVDAGRTGPVVVALDARKGEILISAYAWSEAGGLRTLIEPKLVGPGDVLDRIASLAGGAGVPIRGDAPASYPEAFRGGAFEIEPDGSPLVSSPLSLARLAMGRIRSSAWDDPDVLEPLYSRPPPVHRAERRD